LIPQGRYATNEEREKPVLFPGGPDSEFGAETIIPINGGMIA